MKKLLEKVKEILLSFKLEIVIFVSYFIFLLFMRIIIPISYVLWNLGYEIDNEFYYLMAQDITYIFKKKIMQPFCYRILLPFLVYLLPFNITFSFALIGFISYYLLGILLYFTLRIHFNEIYSILGLILFIVFIEFTFYFLFVEFGAVYLIDPLAFLFFICCFYAILKQKNKLYGIFLFFGVLTKESVLFTIPVFFLYNYYRKHDKFEIKNGIKSIIRNTNYILPAIFSFLLLRLVVNPLPVSEHYIWYLEYHQTEYMSFEYFLMMIQREITLFKSEGFYFYTFGTWSILPIFCLFNKVEDVWKWIKIYGIFMCCVYLQLIMAFGRARLLYIAYYPIIYLSVLGIKRIVDLLGNYIQKSNEQIYIIGFKKNKELSNKLFRYF